MKNYTFILIVLLMTLHDTVKAKQELYAENIALLEINHDLEKYEELSKGIIADLKFELDLSKRKIEDARRRSQSTEILNETLETLKTRLKSIEASSQQALQKTTQKIIDYAEQLKQKQEGAIQKELETQKTRELRRQELIQLQEKK